MACAPGEAAAVASNPPEPGHLITGGQQLRLRRRAPSVQFQQHRPWHHPYAGDFRRPTHARAGNQAVQDLPDQAGFHLSARNGRADSAARHVLWSGGND